MLFGKVSVLGLLLSCITWIPALILFFVHAELQGNGWIWENLWMAGSIILASILWIAVISLLAMAYLSGSNGVLLLPHYYWRFYLSADSWLCHERDFAHGMGRPAGTFIIVTTVIWSHLFRLTAMNRHGENLDAIPLWSAWATLLGVCAFCFWLLDRKLRAREVQSA